jgi:signal transduction histidine kinase
MSAFAVVVGVLLAGIAAASLIRLGSEREARRRVEHRLHELDVQRRALEAETADQGSEWRAVLAHELRSSLAAILGYSELLADGTFGGLDERGVGAARRIGFAADQLLGLIQALEDSAVEHAAADPVTGVTGRGLLEAAAESLMTDADARGTRVILEDDGTEFRTRRAVAVRAVNVALGAALKVSAGGTLRLFAAQEPEPAIVIAGTQLDPSRDDPEHAGTGLTGAGLRLGLARRSARLIGGDVRLHSTADGTRVTVTLPPISD